MELIFDAINVGEKVFVNLGYMTVKHGLVIGHKITCINDETEIEYLAKWFGGGDRKDEEEWFVSRDVHKNVYSAFMIKPPAPEGDKS